jgi:hypothetical protein
MKWQLDSYAWRLLPPEENRWIRTFADDSVMGQAHRAFIYLQAHIERGLLEVADFDCGLVTVV